MAQRARHYNRNMGLKTWKKWTDWPLMVLSVVFLVVYSWEILSRTHIAHTRDSPLVRGGSQLTMWRAYKAETKGR